MAIGPAVSSYLGLGSGLGLSKGLGLGSGLGSGLGLSEGLFPVGATGDQRLPAGQIVMSINKILYLYIALTCILTNVQFLI